MEYKEKRDILRLIASVQILLETNFLWNTENIIAECIEKTENINVILSKSNTQKSILERAKRLFNQIKKINTDDFNSLEKTSKRLLLQFEKLYDDVIKIDCTIKVVFLPYMVSMWPCLESIYKACENDRYCEVKVVPIPYFERGNEFSTPLLHYDAYKFDKNVPISYYKNYSLDKDKPDLAIIHNPYDANNTITMVPAEYFSSSLLKKVGRVIYIPYYNARFEYDADLQFKMPGVYNSWRIYVQSDALRKRYLLSGHNPEKIIGIGSPKSDYIYKMMNSNIDIPIEWEDIIKDKTVFFYNTHMLKIGVHKYEAFDEMNYILNAFSGRDDLAIIWRPHPLTLEALNTDDEGLLDLYTSFIHEFKSLKNSILDTSGDYSAAFSVSDAYLGDESSLILEYALLDKPICIRDEDIKIVQNRFEPDQIFFDMDTLYSFNNKKTLEEFIDKVCIKYDPKREIRKNAIYDTLGIPDGKIGERIWKSIKSEYEMDILGEFIKDK
ncbi:CDP-glycerol glycerophosphotransferase family protein [Metaclostridioides mangenotii]|uniref:CDP-glycerol glycerophosphotransferase family protein n=1 Tax=Metaclostridioides mangenotii TaxID=1540 RepID=UPI0026E98D90|nr:CDP-glycerol glycerophosphotransferase family protein [Clostridioides mangenotii]